MVLCYFWAPLVSASGQPKSKGSTLVKSTRSRHPGAYLAVTTRIGNFRVILEHTKKSVVGEFVFRVLGALKVFPLHFPSEMYQELRKQLPQVVWCPQIHTIYKGKYNGKNLNTPKTRKTNSHKTKFFICSSITLKLLILVVTAKYISGCLDLVDFTRVLPLLFGCPDALTIGQTTFIFQ